MTSTGPETQQVHGGASDSYFQDGQGSQDAQRPEHKRRSPSPSGEKVLSSERPRLNEAPQLGSPPTYEETFKLEKPKYNDLWAGILLILVFLGFAAVSGLTINAYASNKGFNGDSIYDTANDFGLNTNTIILFAFVLVVALVLSTAYFWLARHFTKQFIWITGILQIIFGLGTAIVYFARHYYSAAVVFLLFSVFHIVCFISWIPRIPLSVIILETVMDVAKTHGHIFTVSFLGGFVATALSAWFSVTLTAIYVKYQPGGNPSCTDGSCSSAKVIGLLVFVTFAGYWISEWLRQTIHTSIAGVYGSWYFCSRKPGGMPKNATLGAFRRAITYSFGSISFGSLIVSVIQLLRQAVTLARRQEGQQGNIAASILFCILGCLVGILEWVVTFINHYAFSHIALYGKAYIPAAKDTWKMLKNRGIDALVNDCLIDPVLTMGALFVAYVCTLLAYLYMTFTNPGGYNDGGAFTPVVMAFAFLIGLQIANVVLAPIKSGTATFFVATAWDPQVLMTDFPDLYDRLVAVYPHIQTAIHA
ncbi:MAG: hypothetical protein M1825_003583 [Sarcosagium campestre]|nr:MAG: hypothetical protein M1825_003583 [Sarcosagium campestre]